MASGLFSKSGDGPEKFFSYDRRVRSTVACSDQWNQQRANSLPLAVESHQGPIPIFRHIECPAEPLGGGVDIRDRLCAAPMLDASDVVDLHPVRSFEVAGRGRDDGAGLDEELSGDGLAQRICYRIGVDRAVHTSGSAEIADRCRSPKSKKRGICISVFSAFTQPSMP